MLPATSDRPLTGAEQAAVRQKEWVVRRRAEAALQAEREQKEEAEKAARAKEKEKRRLRAKNERYRGLPGSEKRAAYEERYRGLPGSEKRAAYNERYRGLPGSEKRAAYNERMAARRRARNAELNALIRAAFKESFQARDFGPVASDKILNDLPVWKMKSVLVPIGGTPLEMATKGHAARKRPDGFTEVTMPDGKKHCVGSEGDEKWHRHRKAEAERLREEAINQQTIKLGKGPSIFVRLGSKDSEGSDITPELLAEFKSEVAKAIRAEAKFFVVFVNY